MNFELLLGMAEVWDVVLWWSMADLMMAETFLDGPNPNSFQNSKNSRYFPKFSSLFDWEEPKSWEKS
jgi:hypothetical protein